MWSHRPLTAHSGCPRVRHYLREHSGIGPRPRARTRWEVGLKPSICGTGVAGVDQPAGGQLEERNSLYPFPIAVVTADHTFSGLKPLTFVLLWVWRSEV